MKISIPESITRRFVPNLEAADLLEYFLISSVTSLLVIRTFLFATGYPQLGGGNFHIAHMLWGGLIMFFAILISLAFINASSRIYVAILGGIGFGTFIDELGKFITADNNYFYQPTIAIIYLIFIGIFLLTDWMSSIVTYSSKTYVSNAAEALKELAINNLNEKEKDNALRYLAQSDTRDPLVRILQRFLKQSTAQPDEVLLFDKVRNAITRWYANTLHVTWIAKGLLILFILITVVTFGLSTYALAFMKTAKLSFQEYGYLISNIVMGAFVFMGIYFYARRNIIRCYDYLLRATLISIFFTQFFVFLQNEIIGVIWLLLSVSFYVVLKYTTTQEKIRTEAREKL